MLREPGAAVEKRGGLTLGRKAGKEIGDKGAGWALKELGREDGAVVTPLLVYLSCSPCPSEHLGLTTDLNVICAFSSESLCYP